MYSVISSNYDSLVQILSNLIMDTFNKCISEFLIQTVSLVDIATLVAAFIAATVSSISIIISYQISKENRESNERIAEASIDANLTANARIQWIQNVRQATAELISASYKYLGSDPKEQQKNWEIVQEKKALYVLYFGPDDDESEDKLENNSEDELEKNNESREKLLDNLLDKKTNKGKNGERFKFCVFAKIDIE